MTSRLTPTQDRYQPAEPLLVSIKAFVYLPILYPYIIPQEWNRVNKLGGKLFINRISKQASS
jgi:hypothetical protein